MVVEQKAEQRPSGSVQQVGSWCDQDVITLLKSVDDLSGRRKRSGGSGCISYGIASYRWLLLLGDALFAGLAGFLSTWIRFGLHVNMLREYAITWTVMIVLLPPVLYVFDLYGPERSFRSWDTAYRSALAVVLAAILVISVFFIAPFGAYGRGIVAIQVLLAWFFVNGWRWLYGIYFQKAALKIPVIIVGAGSSGRVLYDLLKSPLSPYEVRGFVDDDPTRTGTNP
jgi:FlaA1/EpsC-like NDP-sugar epimerase